MKKNVFFFVLTGLLMTSCLKDGFNDFDALNHDMSFHGEISPTFGVPIGHGETTIYDMLNMVQLTTANLEISENDVVTITYDTAFTSVIDLKDNSKSNKGGAKDGEIVHVSRNSIEGAVNIDLFDNILLLDTSDIEVDSLLVSLKAFVKASAEDSAAAIDAMNRFHVLIYYDQLKMQVVGQDNVIYDVVNLFSTPGDSLSIKSVLEGDTVQLFNNTDISIAINKRPKQIRYSARMNIAFTEEFFATLGISEDEFVADSIGLETITIDAYIKARFPISAYINNLQYDVDINFDASINLEDLTIDSSMIYIDCLNGIPLEFQLRAQLADSLNQILCDLMDPPLTTIAGADVALNQANGLYTSTGQKETLIQIPVTKNVYDNIMQANKIKLHAGLKTSDTGNPLRNRVAIQSKDKLSLRVWAKIKPSYTLDITLGDDDNDDGNGNNGSKGGV